MIQGLDAHYMGVRCQLYGGQVPIIGGSGAHDKAVRSPLYRGSGASYRGVSCPVYGGQVPSMRGSWSGA